MIPTSYPSREEIARLSARMLLEIGAVNFNTETPYTLASGLPSPSYIDCRKLISFPRIRTTLMDFLTVTVMRNAGFEAFDNIAGGGKHANGKTHTATSCASMLTCLQSKPQMFSETWTHLLPRKKLHLNCARF